MLISLQPCHCLGILPHNTLLKTQFTTTKLSYCRWLVVEDSQLSKLDPVTWMHIKVHYHQHWIQSELKFISGPSWSLSVDFQSLLTEERILVIYDFEDILVIYNFGYFGNLLLGYNYTLWCFLIDFRPMISITWGFQVVCKLDF